MIKDCLIKEIERKTQKKVERIENVVGGNVIKKTHNRVVFIDGTSALVKKTHLSISQLNRINTLDFTSIPCFQKMISIIQYNRNESYVLMEWKEGDLLDNDISMGKGNSIEEKMREAALSIRYIHEKTMVNEKVYIDDKHIDVINKKKYLSDEQKEIMVSYIKNNINLINGRRKSLIHGDLHLANMLDTENGIVFIDLDDVSTDDPYIDLVYAANIHYTQKELYKYYCFINSYFEWIVPKEFWIIVNVYSFVKAMRIMETEMTERKMDRPILSIESLLYEHDNMRSDVPNWYKRMDELVKKENSKYGKDK